jgi:acyl-CoA hydrolase
MVTEFGTAGLKGQTVEEHAKRLIAIAHPDDRENPDEAGGMRAGAMDIGEIKRNKPQQ